MAPDDISLPDISEIAGSVSMADLQERFVTAVDNVQSAVSSAALWLFVASLISLVAAAGGGFYAQRK